MKKVCSSIQIYFLILGLSLNIGCKKFIEIDPPVTSRSSELVFNDDATAIAAMTGVYVRLSGSFQTGGISSLSVYGGLSADELTLFALNSLNYINFYQNNLTPLYVGNNGMIFWNSLYEMIYSSNSVIEGLNSSTKITPAVKNQLLGEAYFMRALCHFYLINIYGDIPLVLSTSYTANATISRNSKNEVYKKVVEDLQLSKSMLNNNYVDASLIKVSTDRIRPNKYAAAALLSRVYLYMSDYVNAESQSDEVIAATNLYDPAVPLNQEFLKNSKETIWSIQPVDVGLNTFDAQFFTLLASGPSVANPVYLSNKLVQSFEINDKRKSTWTSQVVTGGKTYVYASKYKASVFNSPVTEFEIVLRLSEQVLIRAEARAQQSKISLALADLNQIRLKASLPATSALTKDQIVTAILQERNVELFTEFGHRWFDLKRTGKLDGVMNSISIDKGTTWSSNYSLYPIPQVEIERNPSLIQNPGY